MIYSNNFVSTIAKAVVGYAKANTHTMDLMTEDDVFEYMSMFAIFVTLV